MPSPVGSVFAPRSSLVDPCVRAPRHIICWKRLTIHIHSQGRWPFALQHPSVEWSTAIGCKQRRGRLAKHLSSNECVHCARWDAASWWATESLVGWEEVRMGSCCQNMLTLYISFPNSRANRAADFKSQNVFFEFALSCYVRYLRDLRPRDSNVSRIPCVLTAATCF